MTREKKINIYIEREREERESWGQPGDGGVYWGMGRTR